MPTAPLFWQSDRVLASPTDDAETVVAGVNGITTQLQGLAVKLSGSINLAPDADATALVLRIRRADLTGDLVTPAQAIDLGVVGGGVAVLTEFDSDQVQSDATTAIASDGTSQPVDALIAAPPPWMDNAGNIIEPGLYNVATQLQADAAMTTPGLLIGISGPFNEALVLPVDGLSQIVQARVGDIQSLGAADVPYAAAGMIAAPTDVTGTFIARMILTQLASAAAVGGGAGTSVALADVIDEPGNLAGATYVLTAQLTDANGPTTVNAVALTARVD